jgi:predicted nucleic-acid-binding protein
MHAVDTNVLVRLLANDDAEQSKRAAALFKKETIFIPKTVLLETEWVLRRLYHLDRIVVVNAFRKLSGLPNVEIEQPLAIVQALQWCEGGMDFADALHLASSQNASKFVTFDEKMKKSVRAGSKPGVKLL